MSDCRPRRFDSSPFPLYYCLLCNILISPNLPHDHEPNRSSVASKSERQTLSFPNHVHLLVNTFPNDSMLSARLLQRYALNPHTHLTRQMLRHSARRFLCVRQCSVEASSLASRR